jgi:putative tryptophan/tyrosine transport system substrate-binding protein
MTTRRQLLVAAILGAVVPARVFAQARPRVGILAGTPREKSYATPLLLERLAELGYKDRATLAVEYRYAARLDRVPTAIRELLERKCDLIFVLATETNARALREAQSSVPVVLIADFDPVEAGIVESLARPGGNITGVYIPVSVLVGKRIEIAHEILPAASRYLALADPFSKSEVQGMRKAADVRGLRLTVVEFTQQPYDLAGAFETGRKEGMSGVFLPTSPEFIARRTEISALLARHRLPAFAPNSLASEPGILASYSVDSRRFIWRAAEMAARILRGAKPSDMPLEQPSEFSVVINLRTAKALGIRIPSSVLARATQVIE